MSLELVNVAASPKAAKKRAALISAEERVSLIDSEGEPSEPIGSSTSVRANGSSHKGGGDVGIGGGAVSESWIYSLLPMSLLAVLTGTTPNNQDPAAKAKRRRRKKKPPTTEEEEFVSLLGGDGKPTSNKNRRDKRPQPPVTLQEHYEQFRREWSVCRMIRYFLLMLSSASVTYWIMRKEEAKILHWEHQKPLLVPPVPQGERCHAINRNEVPTTNNINLGCQCPDPDVPIPQTISSSMSTDPTGDASTGTATTTATPRILRPWKQQHDRMVADAQRAYNVELDMVMIGDSIIERWNGTRHMGSEVIPGMKQVFNQRFTKAGGGMYEGLALGCSGDMGPNLLWHLRNGLLEPLNPKVWFVMIGTNDLFTGRCADKFVFANILNVLQELHQHRPDAQFIVHGILPRKDPKHNETQFLGEYWRMSQAVNAKVKKFCNNYPNLHYLQGGSAFMVDNDSARGRKQIDPQLLADGIHPTRKGLVQWGNFILDKLNETLVFAEKAKAAERKKNRHSFHVFGGGGKRRLLEDEEHGEFL